MAGRDDDIALSETMVAPSTPPQRTPAPTPPPRPAPQKSRSIWPIVVGALVLVAGGIAIAVYAMREETAPVANTVSPTVVVDAAASAPEPIVATSPEELVVHVRAAISRGDEAALASLLAPNAFGHGIDAGDVASNGPAVAGMVVTMLGKPPLTSTWSKIARDNDVAWIADELDVGRKRKVMTTQLGYRDGNTWRIAAWHLGELLRNPVAAELAAAGKLPPPAPVKEQFDDDHQVHDAFKKAFESREAFTAAFSDRTDAINLGSAPNERVLGGPAIKRWASSTNHSFRVVDAVAAGRVGDRVGWGAANVEYTHGNAVQTYRVLGVLVNEKKVWRLVLVQWTNAGPFP